MTEQNTTQAPAAVQLSEQPATKSDFSRAFAEDGEKKTHIGGQALLEGIMMRGKYNWAVAVREPDGNIYLEEHDLASGRKKNSWLHWPLIRGCTALVESLGLGFKALAIATEHAFDDEEEVEPRKGKKAAEAGGLQEQARPSASSEIDIIEVLEVEQDANGEEKVVAAQVAPVTAVPAAVDASDEKEKTGEDKAVEFISGFAMVIGVLLGLAIFIVAPAFITNITVGEYTADNALLWNVVDGIIRIAIFLLYLWLIGRVEDIRRMFMYHGAEHKTIHCHEHSLPLTVENARQFPRLHVRCGTAFLLMVLIIAIIVYTLIPVAAIAESLGLPEGPGKFAVIVLSRIILLPLIAGISYEITVKWAGSHPDHPLVKIILWPGMQMQYLTTNEPDDEQLECAIAAMNLVLAREEKEAQQAEEPTQAQPA